MSISIRAIHIPVSYTHLDVYKRQAPLDTKKENKNKNKNKKEKAIVHSFEQTF